MADYREFSMTCPNCHHQYRVRLLSINEIEDCPICPHIAPFSEFANKDNNGFALDNHPVIVYTNSIKM